MYVHAATFHHSVWGLGRIVVLTMMRAQDYPYSNIRINGSLTQTWKLGFRTIGCPYEDFLNIECYGEQIRLSPLGVGLMDTDWDGKYAGVVKTAEVAWHRIPNRTLDCQFSPFLN